MDSASCSTTECGVSESASARHIHVHITLPESRSFVVFIHMVGVVVSSVLFMFTGRSGILRQAVSASATARHILQLTGGNIEAVLCCVDRWMVGHREVAGDEITTVNVGVSEWASAGHILRLTG